MVEFGHCPCNSKKMKIVQVLRLNTGTIRVLKCLTCKSTRDTGEYYLPENAVKLLVEKTPVAPVLSEVTSNTGVETFLATGDRLTPQERQLYDALEEKLVSVPGDLDYEEPEKPPVRPATTGFGPIAPVDRELDDKLAAIINS